MRELHAKMITDYADGVVGSPATYSTGPTFSSQCMRLVIPHSMLEMFLTIIVHYYHTDKMLHILRNYVKL
jgi:fluoride ion exporter CrcB/FEX